MLHNLKKKDGIFMSVKLNGFKKNDFDGYLSKQSQCLFGGYAKKRVNNAGVVLFDGMFSARPLA
jgi:hypothetical protein